MVYESCGLEIEDDTNNLLGMIFNANWPLFIFTININIKHVQFNYLIYRRILWPFEDKHIQAKTTPKIVTFHSEAS